MSTKDIRTSDAYATCDVCGRTLLRGERSDVYLNGEQRRTVCELCKERAIHEGWIREGTLPAYNENEGGSDRRRSLLGRWRARREQSSASTASPTLSDELDRRSWDETRSTPTIGPDQRRRRAGGTREPRHVHAVPTSSEHKVASAVAAFNGSEHPRTVAGVARSLGLPTVSVIPSLAHPALVNVVVSWELCWYRYEVDLADDQPGVRVSDQGYELDELSPDELSPNAVADENGGLSLA